MDSKSREKLVNQRFLVGEFAGLMRLWDVRKRKKVQGFATNQWAPWAERKDYGGGEGGLLAARCGGVWCIGNN